MSFRVAPGSGSLSLRPSLGSLLKRLASLFLVVGERPELFLVSSSFGPGEPERSQELSDLQREK